MASTEHNEFVKLMIKKANAKDKQPEAAKILSPASKDPETKAQYFKINKDEVKKAEENLKRIKSNIK